MKKSIALILTVLALAAMTITAGASEATALDMQQYTVQSYTEAEYNTTSDGMTSVLFRPLTRNISPVPDTALEEVSEFGLEPVYFIGTPRASAHRFTNVSIGSSKPSDRGMLYYQLSGLPTRALSGLQVGPSETVLS